MRKPGDVPKGRTWRGKSDESTDDPSEPMDEHQEPGGQPGRPAIQGMEGPGRSIPFYREGVTLDPSRSFR